MYDRILTLPKNHSFFLFGPRQTGKSTLIRSVFDEKTTLYYDLLKTEEYLRLSANPSLFREEVLSRSAGVTHVVVDEIQRVPALLNEIHFVLEARMPPFFVLSGSSARKLKRSHANLLAGRAWSFHLYPLTHPEIGKSFSLSRALNLGSLPSVYAASQEDAKRTLRSYVETYLKEEIEQEAQLRNLGAFLRFLPMAGDENARSVRHMMVVYDMWSSYRSAQSRVVRGRAC